METPADVTHGRPAAAGTCTDIDPETRKDNILWGICREAGPEGLMSLQAEKDPKFLLLDGVRQKSIIADLLKPFWKDVHQESADELFVRDRHFLSRIAVPPPIVCGEGARIMRYSSIGFS